MKKLNIAVIFGGTNTEHEVAIITALQVMHALIESGHTVLPIYISKQGEWFLGNHKYLDPQTYKNLNRAAALGDPCILMPHTNKPQLLLKTKLNLYKPGPNFDIAFPVFHGRYGEDGTIQGLLELLNIPYCGPSQTVTSISIDKYLTKQIARSLNIPVLNDIIITSYDWENRQPQLLKQIRSLGNQVIIKPNTSGSSIGIAIASSKTNIINTIDTALAYDDRVLVETALDNFTEVNISILGNHPYTLSITEQPEKESSMLSFEDKYIKQNQKGKSTATKGMASAKRLIPAPITEKTLQQIHTHTTNIFTAIHGQGISRIDYLLKNNQIYLNEINAIPGSLSFYLWEKSKLPFPKLVNRLLELGLESNQRKNRLIKTFESNILAHMPLSGSKTQERV